MPHTHTIRTLRGAPVLAVLLLGAAAFPVRSYAQVSGSEIPNLLDFGDLNQNHAGITVTNPQNVAPLACAPVSVDNGLVYLENLHNTDYFQNYDPSANFANASQAANDLATAMGTSATLLQNGRLVGGTAYGQFVNAPGMVQGLLNYIGNGGANPAPSIHLVGGQWATPSVTQSGPPNGYIGTVPNIPTVTNIVPTAQWIAGQLNIDSAVQIGIQWGTWGTTRGGISGFGNYNSDGVFILNGQAGGHAVEVDELSFNFRTNSGTIGLLDSDTGATTATQENGTLAMYGGYLYITYPTTVADLDYGMSGDTIAAANGQIGRIVVDMAENVPDALSTGLALFAGCAALIGAARLRRSFA